MRNWIGTLAVTLASIVVLPATASADEKYIISAETWSYYQEYLGNIKNGLRPGAYAITTDGYSSYYVWCRETQCMPGATYSQEALNGCERESGSECVVFAVRDNIRVDYEIAGKAPSATAAPALSPAPPATNLTVSAAVKAEIDQYLRNAQRTGRVWALAIANDGARVAVASCQATGGGGYFGGGGAGCNLVSGAPQDEASREALQRCGGPTACVLLYKGSTKSANINVYGPGEVPDANELGAAPAPVPSPPPPATKLTVSAEIGEEVEAYLRNTQRAGRAWALAIANDGLEVGVASCPLAGGGYIGGGAGCNLVSGGAQEQASREAVMRCGGPAACTLLYEGAQKRTNIELVGPDGSKIGGSLAATAPSTTPPNTPMADSPAVVTVTTPELAPTLSAAAPEPSPPPPATKIVVSAAVKAEIEGYLENAQRAGRAAALAISQDGGGVGTASCPTSGGWSGGRACEPIKGSPQDLAAREAIVRCGGPTDCVLLYKGTQPAGNIEIVTQ